MVEAALENANSESAHPATKTFASLLLGFIQLLIFASLSAIYWLRPNTLAAITVFPVWVWVIPNLLLILIVGCFLGYRSWAWGLIPLAFGMVHGDAPYAMFRTCYYPAPSEERDLDEETFRVITLNCHDNRDAIAALKRFDPDLVLIQETVARRVIQELQEEFFGDLGGSIWDRDISILSRYPVQPVSSPPDLRGYALIAEVIIPRTDEQKRVVIAPLHLYSPPFRLDLWNINCWQSYTTHREMQLDLIQEICGELPDLTTASAAIIGGDFNAPPNDAVFSQLPSGFEDAYPQTGVGWGCSIPNSAPVLRIDQLWSMGELSPQRCASYDSQGSDHCAVVVDYGWSPN